MLPWNSPAERVCPLDAALRPASHIATCSCAPGRPLHPCTHWCHPAPGPGTHPLDVVLGLLADELDALQHVGDVVDGSLLHVQHLSSPVQVQNPILRLTQEVNEFLGGQPQRCVIASLFPRGDLGAEEERGSVTAQRGPWGPSSIDLKPLSPTLHMSTHFPVYRVLGGWEVVIHHHCSNRESDKLERQSNLLQVSQSWALSGLETNYSNSWFTPLHQSSEQPYHHQHQQQMLTACRSLF